MARYSPENENERTKCLLHLRKEERRGELARSEPSRSTRAPLGRVSWIVCCCWWVAVVVVVVRVSDSKVCCNPSGRDIVAPQITQREQSRARALRKSLQKRQFPKKGRQIQMRVKINLHSSPPACLSEQHLLKRS